MEDLTGQRFVRLTVLGYAGKHGKAHHWRCVCDCGKETTPQRGPLKSGATKSCGCLRNERTFARSTKHGYSKRNVYRSEYRTWEAALRRCHKPNDHAFDRYGAKGITMCDRWRFGENGECGFSCFIRDMGEKPTPKHTLERKKNSLGYSPDNCVWATRTRQARNRIITPMVTWKGQTMPFADACEAAGIDYNLAKGRMWQGWTLERALTEPCHPARKRGKKIQP